MVSTRQKSTKNEHISNKKKVEAKKRKINRSKAGKKGNLTNKIDKNREEKLKKKREAEKLRRQKIRDNSRAHEIYKQKERERWKKRVSEGKVKKIDNMTEREKRFRRKKIRDAVRKYREKLKKVDTDQNNPNSETSQSNCTDTFETPGLSKQTLANILNGKRRVAKSKAKCFRENAKLKKYCQRLQKSVYRLQKKIERAKNKTNIGPVSPRLFVANNIKQKGVSKDIKNQLILGQTLIEQIKLVNESNKDRVSKCAVKKIACGSIIKKYRLLNVAKKLIGPLRSECDFKTNSLVSKITVSKSQAQLFVDNKIQRFYEDNSRMSPGKKETITCKKNKKQKMYLNDTIGELYKKFKAMHPNIRVGFSTFSKKKPFWIVKAKVSDRDTCLCVKHENMSLLTSAAHRSGLIEHNTTSKLISSITCDRWTENCLSRNCLLCSTKQIVFKKVNEDESTYYYKWETIKETRISVKTKKEITVQRMLKNRINLTKVELRKHIKNEINPFFDHVYHWIHQHETIEKLKKSLEEYDLFINMDFSQNYECKYGAEPQAVHFGVSRESVSLHTGVWFTKNHHQSFCTLSKDLKHDAPAIIAHLRPVFKKIFQNNLSIETLHLYSDGPTSQYRSKIFFYLLTNYILENHIQIKTIIYNFSECGHGKGIADGVGAVTKRTADAEVAKGKDIDNFEKLIGFLKSNNDKIWYESVTTEDILHFEKKIKSVNLVTFKGTMKVHQWIWCRDNSKKIKFNRLSCYECDFKNKCKHFFLGSMLLPGEVAERKIKKAGSTKKNEKLIKNKKKRNSKKEPLKKINRSVKKKC